ncbi:MAG TPA: DUF1840 domain-containing protein [Burkholderiaceae bacterium]|nr:DUF1840 domain-containing protein [Burkholderiaceae bacterium]
MLYRFKSRETSDIVMLAADAERLLAILGKTAKAPGIITWPEMGHCLELLEQEAALDAAQRDASSRSEEDAFDETDERPPADQQGAPRSRVSLAQRIAPLTQALERCQRAQADLIWDI